MRTLKENSALITSCIESLKKSESRQSTLKLLKEIEELYSERTVLLSQMDNGDGGWHEAYSAGANNAYKLIIEVLEKL